MPRLLKRSFIDEYLRYVEPATESPVLFHKWAAIGIVSATLKRHVWVDRVLFKAYPNLYIVLVGRPTIGKSAAMVPAIDLVKEAKTANILSDRTTVEYLLEKLSIGFPQFSKGGQGIKIGTDSSCLLVSSEFSVLMTASQFGMSILTDLWDSKSSYQYATRGKGEYKINEPSVTMIGASAQQWLVKAIPSDAVGGGFTRRINFVFANTKDKKVPWPVHNGRGVLYKDLVNDLADIGQLQGEFHLTQDARALFEPYYLSCEANEFEDEASAVYKGSKWMNALKIAMCLSASRGISLEINASDFQEAVDLVEDVAGNLKIVFRAVGESPLVQAQDKVIRFIESQGYASREQILNVNWRHITSEDLNRVIITLREADYLIEYSQGGKIYYKLNLPQQTTVAP